MIGGADVAFDLAFATGRTAAQLVKTIAAATSVTMPRRRFGPQGGWVNSRPALTPFGERPR